MTPAERSAKFKAAHPERFAIYNQRYYERNADRINARNKAWQAANPEKVTAQRRAYYQAHQEERKAYKRAWSAANRAKETAWHAAYAAKNRARMCEIEGRRRVRKEGNGVLKVSARDWRRMLIRYRNRCAYCGEVRKLVMEHIVPIARGGRHSIGNLLPACRSCNARKHDSLLVEWRYRYRTATRSPV
jgi:5-methylcytosine-specific restriction endonuclease McrA